MTEQKSLRSEFEPFAKVIGEDSHGAPTTLPFVHLGEAFVACQSGALFLPDHKTLLVADLHLEKASSFGSRGQFIPPYDSQTTLKQLSVDISHFAPRTVICLGDSFHDVEGPDRLPDVAMSQLMDLVESRDWTWIVGNHDPVLPQSLGGARKDRITLAGSEKTIALCHEPGGSDVDGLFGETHLEICGHLHPVATLNARGRSMRRKCFLLAKDRIILPAYGSFTGGLNVRDEAFAPYLDRSCSLLVIGKQSLTRHPISASGGRRSRPR